MNRQEAIDLIKKLTKTAGAERLRVLFNKYGLTGAPLRASGVITGLRLHGKPFFSDLVTLAKDGYSSKAYADGDTTDTPADTSTTTEAPAGTGASTGMSIWDYITKGLEVGANAFGTVYGAIAGNDSTTYVPVASGTSGQTILIPTSGNSSSGGNTALWVILAVVGVAVVGMVIFLAVRKK
jgi:hypothetical protein